MMILFVKLTKGIGHKFYQLKEKGILYNYYINRDCKKFTFFTDLLQKMK